MVPFKKITSFVLILTCFAACKRQQHKEATNDSNTPLHLLQPAYEVPYGQTSTESVKQVLVNVLNYLEETTPTDLIDKRSQKEIADTDAVDTNSIFKPGDFRLISYEWGVTYTGMMLAGEITGDSSFTDYVSQRLQLIANVTETVQAKFKVPQLKHSAVGSVVAPEALDDAGSMATAFIKAYQKNLVAKNVIPIISNYVDYILNKEYRLADGTLARNRPLPNTLWLDDLYMSLPALVSMGKLTGEGLYFDEALKQYRLFAEKMFDRSQNLYLHGWVEGMEPHPAFYWGRANGWALLTKVELLSALPGNYPGREEVLKNLQAHIGGLAKLQEKTGFWHQLLNKNDTYLETSATAIYTYCIAKAINEGWIDAQAYGPMVLQAWSAVSTQVTGQGQVDGVCVGTGMGFDPSFYAYRPVNKFAAHGYGPVLLAGAEIIRLLGNKTYEINDSAVHFEK